MDSGGLDDRFPGEPGYHSSALPQLLRYPKVHPGTHFKIKYVSFHIHGKRHNLFLLCFIPEKGEDSSHRALCIHSGHVHNTQRDILRLKQPRNNGPEAITFVYEVTQFKLTFKSDR